uniref:Uncharacterized protein n=1 Tax=Magnetococcus massalia (strain MO-1) TaxID=451514 RepID=A0A1S7LK82_MAGMO|nr:conserved protein of unknown function [Candidatus Magnetococcus massalia]
MSNGCDPNLMTAQERLDEAAQILTVGFVRYRQKRVEKSLPRERNSLDKKAKQSVHVSEKVLQKGDNA